MKWPHSEMSMSNNQTFVITSTLSPRLFQPSVTLPPEFTTISPGSRNEVVAYVLLFIIAAVGNLSVFVSVCHQLSKLKWRITVLMLHLSIADLIVTFLLMPVEIVWRLTVSWVGGQALCKGCQFFRAFGLYLSSNILICISLDRFMAILFPLRMVGATDRVKRMIAVAWVAAAVSAAPQCIVFSVQAHPDHPSFQQCVSFGFFSSPTKEILYNVFSISAMYFLPLFVTVFTYSMILWKISVKSHGFQQQSRPRTGMTAASFSHDCHDHDSYPNNKAVNLSSVVNGNPSHQHNCLLNGKNIYYSSESANLLARAKKRTLRMTLVIVIVFVCCWTPYALIHLWYTFDKDTAKQLPPALQDALFIMAVANSCLNPIVYGSYTKKTTGFKFSFNFNCSFLHWKKRLVCCQGESWRPAFLMQKSQGAPATERRSAFTTAL